MNKAPPCEGLLLWGYNLGMKTKTLTKKQQAAKAEWEAILAKHSKPLERGAKAKGIKVVKPKTEPYIPTVMLDPRRDLSRLPSRVTPGGDATKPEPVKYTGTLIKGIATMHKSNAVPVLNDEEAKSISSMRR
ncbi:hypothetical protein [Delftia phage PhiW-14]|uniref:Uncharacterized protein n=1 Tax=Delftia phage PhiW-14 TaxID=665032 RepID=C9DG85_BPW14|nr:hypothetical protein DP-phiW-14_gp115 [Delftia phage PhiW-14]ACV50136.1 hypothetical protein [Delftia phage PhiW-14]